MNTLPIHVPDDVLYRYDYQTSSIGHFNVDGDCIGFGDPKVRLFVTPYRVIKRTPQGAWINHYDLRKGGFTDRRFVLLTARKQFASNTKKEALACFLARKKAQRRILKATLSNVEQAIRLTETENV